LINFRYHIVSLMAVFLALSVGIVLGVTLRGPVNQGLTQQADQDRKTVQDLRSQLDRRNALDDYREAWAQQAGAQITQGALTGRTVAVLVMPDAPSGVVNAVSKAVTASGGTLTHTVKISSDVFDPTKTAAVQKVLQPYRVSLQAVDSSSDATVFGLALGKSVLARQATQHDGEASQIAKALTSANLMAVSGKTTQEAEVAIVVTAPASDPALSDDVLRAHVEMDTALTSSAAGVVVAGPNSDKIEGTDVLTARNSLEARQLSTVDVADLSSGVSTTILACKEQWLGRQGHYGALTRAGAPLPDLPVR